MSLSASSLRIEPISTHHVIENFDCGEGLINSYIKLRVADADELSRIFTAIDNTNRMLGFYSISSANIEFEEIPSSSSQNIDVYPVPAVKIDALAVDLKMQKKGLGQDY